MHVLPLSLATESEEESRQSNNLAASCLLNTIVFLQERF
jgi:hypothetical protein